MKAILLGDAMIGGVGFQRAWEKHMARYGSDLVVNDWEKDWGQLQYRRLEVEKRGPEIETVDETILKEGQDAQALMGLFVPVSSKVMDAMPKLRIVGVSRAGLENVNVEEATRRGILVFNVQGRNAHAVSDFAVGMMLAECRNIARAHFAIRNGEWRKTFTNSDVVPELHGRTVGLVGFGHIGRLVAKKLSGFDVKVVVYDPYTPKEAIKELGAEKVELEELLKNSDFVSVHARLTSENKGMIGEHEIGLMKPTAYFINTGRAGLVDQDALAKALGAKKIMGAALDVFYTEPLPADSPFMTLDNVTLTTHIAGTTADALSNSPFLLMEDVAKFLEEGDSRFIVNRQVLQDEGFKAWLASVRQ
ncbi:2-hydroxyacid dehydrogenase [Enterocloster lavalensis]|uniref:2-hydroxyacid dehydrogenase n=1 Tax=Enterocloster lavalensis TaxID=460384 RepID=UPI001D07CDE6|nr:2-hydroxyacid dehydrogenase [Enterocloster lavalensis]MCB6345573.1 2-hydroxyacid dehydrogenase [Enterocloster lavalensis]